MTRAPRRASATAVAAPSLDADPVTSADKFRRTSSSLLPEFVEQRLCVFEIGRVKAFGEPAVERGEQVAGFGLAALVRRSRARLTAARNSQSLASCSLAMLKALQ